MEKVTLVDPKVLVPLELSEVEVLTHDTKRYRFALPTKDHVLGIKLGQHLKFVATINGDNVGRHYTPLSPVETRGYFDTVIKVYKADRNPDYPNGGPFSQYIDALNIGDRIDVRGPTGRLAYNKNGNFELKFEKGGALTTLNNIKHLGMIAGGTGIAPMIQLIQDICENSADQTKMSLVYSNKTADDIILRNQLDTYVANHSDKLKIWHTLSSVSSMPGWKYDFGRVNEEMLRKHLPAPGEGTLLVLCGPKPMIRGACIPYLEKLGYTKQMIYVC